MISARRLARALCRCAARAAPPDARVWAEAMIREIDEVEDGAAALDWAWGCLCACIMERIRSMRSVMFVLRLGLAGGCALLALDLLVSVALVLAYRSDSAAALEALAPFLAGDDYGRFIPLLERLEPWRIAVDAARMALVLLAGVLIALRRPGAPWAFLIFLILSAATMAANHADPLFQQTLTAAELRAGYVWLAMEAAVGVAMFWAVRRREPEAIV